MKNILPLILLTLLGTTTACQRQFAVVEPGGSSLSLAQVREGATINDEHASATLLGMYSQLSAYESVLGSGSGSGDFGIPSLGLRLDQAGDNMTSTLVGYNWFSKELKHDNFQSKGSFISNCAWNYSYANISLANQVIKQYRGDKSDVARHSTGEARAMRAWDYFLLVQLFAPTYVGHEESPAVPIVTETTLADSLSYNPRRTVREIYDLILSDLDAAAELLKGYTPEKKNRLSEAAVYGIRARVRLVRNEWDLARDDARRAIETFRGRPYSLSEVSVPTFDDVQEGPGTIWGIIIDSENIVAKQGLHNITSNLVSLGFGTTSYTNQGKTFKMINTRLWRRIPESDVRRGWWAYDRIKVRDSKEGKAIYGYTSPLIHRAYPDLERAFLAERLYPYAVVKFAPTNKDPFYKENSVDYHLLRVEELHYILAEATAMAGDLEGGRQLLEHFVRTYRDPEYRSRATTAEELQEEIYFQRTIELWGEGLNWFDLVRLHKGIERVDVATRDDGGYPETCRFNIPADDPTFVFQLPSREEQNNHALEGYNNPLAKAPKDLI